MLGSELKIAQHCASTQDIVESPENKEFYPYLLAGIDEVSTLLHLARRVGRENGGVPVIRDPEMEKVSKRSHCENMPPLTPNTPSLPAMVVFRNSTSQIAFTTPAPLALSFSAASE
jgi:hypothetical protein